MISDIVVGIVIAWFIIRGLERLADLLSGNDDAESTTPGKPESIVPDGRAFLAVW
jgi:hypothetical protein